MFRKEGDVSLSVTIVSLTVLDIGRQTFGLQPNRRITYLRLQSVLVLLGMTAPVFAQYAGPAVLSRGEAPAAMSAPEIRFRPFVEISAMYDTGLAGVAVNNQGDLADSSSYGLNFAWGVSGTHSWRRTKVGLDYRGSIDHYFQQTFYDSLSQSMLLGISHRLSRRSTFTLNTGAGIFSRDFGLAALPQTVPFDPSTVYIPTTDFFDNRTYYLTTQGNLSIQKTARLSFNVGGLGFLNRRRSSALYGVIGAGAVGDVQYRISRQSTIGGGYAYQHYEFNRILGGTDVHQFNFAFARRLTRWTEFSGYVGAARAETKFLQVVQISPVIAALLGISTSTQITHDILWEPNVSARLSRTFHTGVLYIAGGHEITPGNGLFLTSASTSVFAGYSYTGLRRWSFGTQAAYSRAQSFGNIGGTYGSESFGLSVSRQIIHSVHFVANYSARRYDSPDYSKYNRLIHNVRVGVGFAPGDVPLRIW